MPAKKQYAGADNYERKLERIMERFGASDYDYNFDRHGAWVEFHMKNQLYRFEHTLDKAAKSPQPLTYGSDCFAQIVLSLEDLARMAERGIYELQTWLEGMRFLPAPVKLPDSFRVLGFDVLPDDVESVKKQFKALAKQAHPDSGGDAETFIALQTAADEAIAYMEATVNGTI